MTSKDQLFRQRLHRKLTGNAATKKYEKTKRGFLMRLYRNMESRTQGIQKLKYHLYKNCELLPRQEFYEWSLGSKKFHRLFRSWELSKYQRRLTPSVDRIDSRKGYRLSNMRWVPFHENCRNVRRPASQTVPLLSPKKSVRVL